MEELNIKPKYWKDLIDDTPFTRKDIIHLQDPLNLEVSAQSTLIKSQSIWMPPNRSGVHAAPTSAWGRPSEPSSQFLTLPCSQSQIAASAIQAYLRFTMQRIASVAQGRNVENFDHVKMDLKIEDEDAAEAAAKDPATFLKTEGLSEDMKRVMAKLYTPDALKASPLVALLPHCPSTRS